MSRLRFLHLLFALAVGLLWLGTANDAQAQPVSENKQVAKLHFRQGIERFDHKDFRAAIAQFRIAYQHLPRPVILYNVGLSHTELGEPVPALEAMEQALAGTPPLSERFASRAREIVAAQRRRVAKLEIKCNVEGAEIMLNGEQLGTSPIGKNVRVADGEHVVLAKKAGFVAAFNPVQVVPGSTKTIIIELTEALQPSGQLMVDTEVPGARLYIDGKLAAVTPFRGKGTIPLEADKEHLIELKREGYATAVEKVTVKPGQLRDLVLQPSAKDAEIIKLGSELGIVSELVDANIFIDGEQYRLEDGEGTIAVAPGLHIVTARRAGYLSIERQVVVPRGERVVMEIALPPTEETRNEKRDAATLTRGAGIGLTIGGAVLAGAAIGVLVWNRGEDDAVADRRAAFDAQTGEFAMCAGGITVKESDACEALDREIIEDENEAEGFYAGGAIGLTVGMGALVTGIVLLATGDDPDAFRLDAGGDELSLAPTWQLGPNGASFGIRGRF